MEPPSTAYRRLVGLIGAPAVDVPIGLVEVETARAILARVPNEQFGQFDDRTPLRERAAALMRELDHRVGAALAAMDGAADEARVPLTTDDLDLVREVIDAQAREWHSGQLDKVPAAYTGLLITLDRRRGAEQYRNKHTKSDPGA